ncbi:MAG TPA: nuclear transport factor 2 family protein [Gemmatimonadaceae bacterium]|nr:nuclear transport factor 2 family protein [Gemmatimonadaceae bacterium]
MQRSIIAVAFALGASSTAVAQAVPPGTVPPKLNQEQATQLNLARLEELWTNALMRRDRAAVERLLAPKFVYTLNDRLLYRPEYVAQLLAPGDIVADARVDSVEVQAAGNIGVATGWRTIAGRGREGPFERRYRFTDTWMPRSGTWQLIAAHDYLVTPPPK